MCGQIQQTYMAYGAKLGEYLYLHILYISIHVWSNTAKYTGHMMLIWESIFTNIIIVHFMCLSNAAKTTGQMVL